MASALNLLAYSMFAAPGSALASGDDIGAGSQWMIVVVGAIAVLAAIVTIVLVSIGAQRRDRVRSASQALRELEALNLRSGPLIPVREAIRLHYGATVSSKARFDRFNLQDWMEMNLLEHEQWLTHELNVRLAATQHFVAYDDEFQDIARTKLGRSSHPQVKASRFNAIEDKIFHSQKLPYPTATAVATGSVTYTSPKGQNSYLREITWDFRTLRQGLRAAQLTRKLQSTTQARRARERSLMTPGLRMTILRRDSFRCQMCGASAPSGATLHVDHITPVSLGGSTTPDNLQALCDTCNLGKSNRFIG